MREAATTKNDPAARAILRAEIEELVVESAYLLDRGRFAENVALFTEDCEVSRPAPPFTGPQTDVIRGRAALAEWYASPAWPRTPRTMRHVVTNLRLGGASADRVEATVTWTGFRHEGDGISVAAPMAVGDYEDEYRKDRDGRWRIHRRRIVIAFLNQELLAIATAAAGGENAMAEKFELASRAWLEELFRLFREAAAAHPEITFSLCEVFTKVPARLGPDAGGKIAWHGRVRDGRAELDLGEVDADSVDLKTIAEWDVVLPLARHKIDLANPADFQRYLEMADRAAAEGRIQRFGDRTKAPLAFVEIHNVLAERTL